MVRRHCSTQQHEHISRVTLRGTRRGEAESWPWTFYVLLTKLLLVFGSVESDRAGNKLFLIAKLQRESGLKQKGLSEEHTRCSCCQLPLTPHRCVLSVELSPWNVSFGVETASKQCLTLMAPSNDCSFAPTLSLCFTDCAISVLCTLLLVYFWNCLVWFNAGWCCWIVSSCVASLFVLCCVLAHCFCALITSRKLTGQQPSTQR